MPTFRTYSPEEVSQTQTRRGRTVDLTAYIAALRDLTPGQMGEAVLSGEDKKATVKRRLTAAAKKLGMELRYRRSGENKVVYEVIGRQ